MTSSYEKGMSPQPKTPPEGMTTQQESSQKGALKIEQQEQKTYPGRGYFIAVESPRGNWQEASFPPELLSSIGEQDKLMAEIIRGQQRQKEQHSPPTQEIDQPPLTSLSSQIINNFNKKYLDPNGNILQNDSNTTQNEINLYQILLDTIPDYFVQMNNSQILTQQLIKMMFEVAASDGIDSAINGVLIDYPFSKEKVDLAKKQMSLDNDRFFNLGINHPITNVPVFAKCAGFRTAKALENQLIIAILQIEELAHRINVNISSEIPKTSKDNPSIGDTIKNKILSM